MVRLYLVRHGHAVAGSVADPGLDDAGRAQAEAVARSLAPRGPLPILSSPLLRARETAAPLARLWGCQPVVEAAIAELPSGGLTGPAREAWLQRFMAGSWHSAPLPLAIWREALLAALLALPGDTVVVSHFIAINTAYGAATGDARVAGFTPANGSVTVLDTVGQAIRLIEKGREAAAHKVR
jgi:probable phosphoglycerate mutase